MPRRTSVVAVITALALLVPAVASAGSRAPDRAVGAWRALGRPAPAAPVAGPGFSISRDDGNDTKGPLDLSSMKITRGGSKDTIVFTNDTPVTNAQIDPTQGGNFAILFDTNDNRKYDYGQYVYYYRGKLRGVLVKLSTNRVVDRTVPTSRVNSRTFRTIVLRSKIHSPGTYRFAVFTYYDEAPCSRKNPCGDAIPNRFPLIALDHKAPSVKVTNLDAFANDASSDLTTPLDFTFSDDEFGTGVKTWVVERKQVGGSGDWVQVKKGTIQDPTVNVPGGEGLTYQVRVVVVDKQKNKQATKIARTTFAIDDRDSGIAYGGTTTQGTPTGSFLGTTTSVATGGTVTISFSGKSDLCVMGGPVTAGQTASVDATIDGSPVAFSSETDTTAALERVTCFLGLTVDLHTLVLTVTSAEPYVIDGYYER